MSSSLISRSSDLTRLVNDGYRVEVRNNYLLIRDVPYVNAEREVKFGILVSELTLAGDITTTPSTHVAYFIGGHPCRSDGTKLSAIEHQTFTQQLDHELTVHHSFSSKPPQGYGDYYDKMTTYAAILSSQAQVIDSTVTQRGRVTLDEQAEAAEDSVFHYRDTASSRAEINLLARKLEVEKIAIVGLGGTGGYMLDLVAKTPVKQIHIFDGDTFSNHNAFRAPGAPTLEDLRDRPQKAAYFHDIYSRMHRGIVCHDFYIEQSNVHLLTEMDFVFICLEGVAARNLVVSALRAVNVPFIDVGMGLSVVDERLLGSLRVTTETRERTARGVSPHLPLGDVPADDVYSRNVQVADLNALNAALAVIRWKKLCGFYADFDNERHSVYSIDGNHLLNEDT
ncbi:ThiF family adenylyltransferase [Deinococcus peraridilitoris]|uniref:Dinucleotide-utilizing enzyme possibly involved in molybdopterin or thiamin biosynthesis n=1 Tax=Deinococcus peraridilitoris (strain DSM 19664 / LMG 22246 / CIP 109416 / KR-200) TaxID=937777 RepID=L0A018_DEIPD|nr:ThiF family adenylyltransferase [Deinococcus peraridilitoris]AFZ67176.1 dinucleotide-utilizing enzyme possibly involved in molybdopterin or thiamin biosynthesis [Deinococcus peraridilitoris DSM 19664]